MKMVNILIAQAYFYHSEVVTSKVGTYYPVEEGRRVDLLEDFFRVFSMIKAIEECHRSDISTQLLRLKEVGGFRTDDNANCSPLQAGEGVYLILRDDEREQHSTHQSFVQKTQMLGREEPYYLV